MQKLIRIVAISLALILAACAGKPPIAISSAVTLNSLYTVEAGYGVALAAENTYKNLPLCKTGTTPSLTNICAKRSVIVRLQNADKQVVNAITIARDFIKNNPTLDASSYISTAQNALSALQSILNTK